MAPVTHRHHTQLLAVCLLAMLLAAVWCGLPPVILAPLLVVAVWLVTVQVTLSSVPQTVPVLRAIPVRDPRAPPVC